MKKLFGALCIAAILAVALASPVFAWPGDADSTPSCEGVTVTGNVGNLPYYTDNSGPSRERYTTAAVTFGEGFFPWNGANSLNGHITITWSGRQTSSNWGITWTNVGGSHPENKNWSENLPNDCKKIWVCHKDAQPSNNWQAIEISINAWNNGSVGGHTNGAHGGDFGPLSGPNDPACTPPPPPDLCTNFEGPQGTMPDGYEDPDGDKVCTPIYVACTQQTEQAPVCGNWSDWVWNGTEFTRMRTCSVTSVDAVDGQTVCGSRNYDETGTRPADSCEVKTDKIYGSPVVSWDAGTSSWVTTTPWEILDATNNSIVCDSGEESSSEPGDVCQYNNQLPADDINCVPPPPVCDPDYNGEAEGCGEPPVLTCGDGYIMKDGACVARGKSCAEYFAAHPEAQLHQDGIAYRCMKEGAEPSWFEFKWFEFTTWLDSLRR